MYKQFSYLRKRPTLIFLWFVILLWVVISISVSIANFFGIMDTLRVVVFIMLTIQIVISTIVAYGVFAMRSWTRWLMGIFAVLWVFTDSFFFGISLIAVVLYVYLYDEYMAVSLSTVASRVSPKQ